MPEPTKTDERGREIVISKDYRIVFANTMRIRAGDNDCAVSFGVETDDSAGAIHIVDQVQVVMTPRTVKMLVATLGSAIVELEKALGAPIPVPAAVAQPTKATDSSG